MAAKALLARNPQPQRSRDPRGPGGQPLPLHRVPQDHPGRGVGGGAAARRRLAAAARSALRRRAAAEPTATDRWLSPLSTPRDPRRRRAPAPAADRHAVPPGRRPRQGHRPDPLRRRPRLPAHGVPQAGALDRAARAHPRASISSGGAGDARACSAFLTGKRLPGALRHPAGVAGRARALPRRGALRRRSGGGGRRDHRGRRERGGARGARRVRAAAHDRQHRGGARASPEPTASTTTATSGNLHKKVSHAVRRRRRRLRRGGADLRGPLLLRGHHPPAARAARRGGGARGRRPASPSTPRPRRRTTCTARWPRCWSCRRRASAWWRCSNGGGFGGKSDPFNHEIVAAKMALVLGRPVKITLTREEVFYCHRGRHPVLMRLRTGVRRGATGGSASPPSTCRRRSTAAPTAATASPRTYYTGALQTVTYDLPRYRFDGVRAFTNKPPCGPKRGHGTPQPRFALRGAPRQDRGGAGRRTRPTCGCGCWRRPDPSPPTGCASARSACARCIEAVVAGSALPRALGEAAGGPRARAWPAAPTCAAPGCRSTGTTCRSPACSCKLDRSGGVAVVLRREPRSARARTRCSPRWWPRCWASALADIRLSRRRHRSHAGRPRQLLVARHADGRQRRARGGGAGARPDRQGRGAPSSRSRRRAWCSPRTRVFDAADPEQGALVRRGGGRGGGALRHAGHHRLLHPAARARQATAAPASAPLPPTRTPPR